MRNEKEMYSKIFRRIREDRRLTQYQMAELAECSLRNYQNIEAGISQPSYRTLNNMVKNLKLAPCELFLNKEALEYDSTICEIKQAVRNRAISYLRKKYVEEPMKNRTLKEL